MFTKFSDLTNICAYYCTEYPLTNMNLELLTLASIRPPKVEVNVNTKSVEDVWMAALEERPKTISETTMALLECCKLLIKLDAKA